MSAMARADIRARRERFDTRQALSLAAEYKTHRMGGSRVDSRCISRHNIRRLLGRHRLIDCGHLFRCGSQISRRDQMAPAKEMKYVLRQSKNFSAQLDAGPFHKPKGTKASGHSLWQGTGGPAANTQVLLAHLFKWSQRRTAECLRDLRAKALLAKQPSALS